MTSTEYRRLTIQARDSLSSLTRDVMKRIKKVYLQSAIDVAKKVAEAELSGKSQLTVSSLVSIQRQLEDASRAISTAIQNEGVAGIRASVESIGTINDRFLSEAFNEAGVTFVTRTVIAKIVSGVNERVVEATVNRIWQDGYNFSQRVWRSGQAVQDDLRNVLQAGLAQGRDLLKISKDIQVYTADGKVKLMNRYGELLRGTREFSRRIPANIDYRAVRLVRTELYESMRNASVEQSLINPACTQLWDWVRQSSTDWGCRCPDYALRSPYTLQALPSDRHPNCLCAIVPRLVPIREFESRLTAWAGGGADPGLDQWYSSTYLAGA